jgi:hypothetical protein
VPRLLLTVCVLGAAVAASSASTGRAARTCAPPRGPGDSAVHSKDLRVANITCTTGRKVALACVRFTYGAAGACSAAGGRWHCTSTMLPGAASAERCVTGRKSMRIVWTD